MAGLPGTGDEPLPAANHVDVAASFRPGGDHRRVGAAAGMGFGHREGGAHLSLDDRSQPFALLLGRRQRFQHHHVAIVGGGRIEHHRTEDGAVHLLVADGHVHLAETRPASLRLQLQRPQPGGPGLFPQTFQQRQRDVAVIVVGGSVALERQDMLAHEIGDAAAKVLGAGRNVEIHGMPAVARVKRRDGRHRPRWSSRSCSCRHRRPATAARRPIPRACPSGVAECA